ncbi:MAG: glycoside hydrolase family 38 N-terminal domain-containing protein [Pirellulales bacterium]
MHAIPPSYVIVRNLSLLFLATGVTLVSVATAAEPEPEPTPVIKRIDLVHFSHTDFGFTDHPSVCRELYQRYLDIAVDAAAATMSRPEEGKFRWTAETMIPVADWWQSASPERREEFLKVVRAGQLDVTALPLNNAPFLNRAEWQRMLHWIPEDLWQKLRPQVGVQNDVNGFPRAGAVALLDRGIHRLFMGINTDSGGTPFPTPSAFWWKMPDGRRMFVWLNTHYGAGFEFFEPGEWRRGPVPPAADARFRPPRPGDFLQSDEASVRAAHRRCLARIRQLERSGYRFPVVAISMTNQWRIDNDPPFPPLADFVATWTRLKLQPELRLATVSLAMEDLERELGDKAPEYSGEWTDWWANGIASSPRELAASRAAKRFLAAAESNLWGPLEARPKQTIAGLYQELCLFDEHTWGSSWSVALPDSLDTLAQFNEKSRLAYRPMAQAEWLLSQRARTRLVPEGEGLYVANPGRAPFSGWVKLPATALRADYRSAIDPASGARTPILFENGPRPFSRPQKPEELSRENTSATFADNCPGQVAAIWIEDLPGLAIKSLRLSTDAAEVEAPKTEPRLATETNDRGWPTGIRWPAMAKPLFLPGFGDFVSIEVKAFAPRWALRDIPPAGGDPKQERLRKERLATLWATQAEAAAASETPYTRIYTQALAHPGLKWATRRLEVWKHEPRARLTLKINRLSSADPVVYYVAFPLPCQGVLPRASNGGMPFVPYQDQLPGTCRDYFAIDGWAHYATPDGDWLWTSRDAPLVSFGPPDILARRDSPPAETHQVLAMVFNNFWYTNFVADSHGVMEFQFDLVWKRKLESDAPIQDAADALSAEPVVVLNPGLKEDPRVMERLNRP